MASLTLNVESQLHDDYANCINRDVLDDPNQWATALLDEHTSFALLPEEMKMQVAAEAAEQIETDCRNACPNEGTCSGLCDGCMSGLVYIYG